MSWTGDHSPCHVHVYKDGELVCRWNLETMEVLTGKANRRIRAITKDLVKEGEL